MYNNCLLEEPIHQQWKLFSKSTHLLGINWSSPYQASKLIDSTGDVIGSGCHHLVSAHHLDMRNSIFEQLREQQMKYLPKDYKPPLPYVDKIKMYFIPLSSESVGMIKQWTVRRLIYSLCNSCQTVRHYWQILLWSGRNFTLVRPMTDNKIGYFVYKYIQCLTGIHLGWQIF